MHTAPGCHMFLSILVPCCYYDVNKKLKVRSVHTVSHLNAQLSNVINITFIHLGTEIFVLCYKVFSIFFSYSCKILLNEANYLKKTRAEPEKKTSFLSMNI